MNGHIQAECANTWSNDESEACNEGEDLCNESLVPANLSAAEQCSRDQKIYAFSPPLDASTYESLVSMIALDRLDFTTIDVESGDDKEISDEEMDTPSNSCMRSL